MQFAITAFYYVLSFYILLIGVMNFVKTKDVQESMLYGLLFIPLLLRLLRLK